MPAGHSETQVRFESRPKVLVAHVLTQARVPVVVPYEGDGQVPTQVPVVGSP